MAAKKLKPIDLVTARFGGVRKLGRAIGTENGACHWKRRGGIPRDRMAQILEAAKKQGIQLTAEEMIHGGVL